MKQAFVGLSDPVGYTGLPFRVFRGVATTRSSDADARSGADAAVGLGQVLSRQESYDGFGHISTTRSRH